MNVIITGGTGLVGRALTKALVAKGYDVTVLTSSVDKKEGSFSNIQYSHWDIDNMLIDNNVIAKTDYIIHLAGAGIASQRWTKKYKSLIRSSRINGSTLLAKRVNAFGKNVKGVVSASAIGWYGADGHHPVFTEADEAATDFLGTTCKEWESAINEITVCPVACIRTGIVLSREGGAVPQLMQPLRFGVCPILGSGKQKMSWIHINDLVRIYISAMEKNLSGSYNAVAPSPVSQHELSIQLATAKRGKFFTPFYIPRFLLKIVKGAGALEALKSTTVSCKKIKDTGFIFQFPDIKSCISELV